MSFLTSAPLPAFTLVLGCITGIMSSHHVPDDAIAPAAAPTAAAAIEDGGPVEPDATSVDSRTIYRAPDGLFYVTAKVNGRPIRFLVDTGASVMVLRQSDAEAIGVSPRTDARTRITGVGGSTAMGWTQVGQISVGGKQVHNIRAAVAKRGLAVSLLGQNLLSRVGKLHIDGDRLDFE